jgi:hypothetical protein
MTHSSPTISVSSKLLITHPVIYNKPTPVATKSMSIKGSCQVQMVISVKTATPTNHEPGNFILWITKTQ